VVRIVALQAVSGNGRMNTLAMVFRFFIGMASGTQKRRFGRFQNYPSVFTRTADKVATGTAHLNGRMDYFALSKIAVALGTLGIIGLWVQRHRVLLRRRRNGGQDDQRQPVGGGLSYPMCD
jgi:hypothetical protein